MAVRYGGEEFILLLPDFNYETAFSFAEMIRLDVLHDKMLADLTKNTFSVSGGVAVYKMGMSTDEWIRQADANLYTAKKNGKNRIVG